MNETSQYRKFKHAISTHLLHSANTGMNVTKHAFNLGMLLVAGSNALSNKRLSTPVHATFASFKNILHRHSQAVKLVSGS